MTPRQHQPVIPCIVSTVGVDREGKKHVLGIGPGATENSALVKRLQTHLREQGLATDRQHLFVIEIQAISLGDADFSMGGLSDNNGEFGVPGKALSGDLFDFSVALGLNRVENFFRRGRQ
jgi:hypothetical protein